MKVLLKQFNLDAIYLSEMIKQLAFRVYYAMKTLSMLMVCKNGCGISNSRLKSLTFGNPIFQTVLQNYPSFWIISVLECFA